MNKLKIFTSFDIKIIAFITMIIDHFAYFFYYAISNDTYTLLRCIGRISMPLFAFCLYQGYKHTSNLNNYIKRIFKYAVVTQLIVVFIGIIIKYIFPSIEYKVNFYTELNILFSFFLSLLILKVFNFLENFNIEKVRKIEYVSIVLVCLIVIFSYMLLKIEYGILVPIIILSLYIYDNISKIKVLNKTASSIMKIAYIIFISTILLFILSDIQKFCLFAIIPLALYNGKKGKYNLKSFYILYPVQYIVLYIAGIIGFIVK